MIDLATPNTTPDYVGGHAALFRAACQAADAALAGQATYLVCEPAPFPSDTRYYVITDRARADAVRADCGARGCTAAPVWILAPGGDEAFRDNSAFPLDDFMACIAPALRLRCPITRIKRAALAAGKEEEGSP